MADYLASSFQQQLRREQAEGFRWFSPYVEASRRKLHLNLLAIAMLVAFVFPTLIPGPDGDIQVYFNLQILGASTVPTVVKILLVYPGAAALVALAFATLSLPPVRGLALAALGLGLFAVLLAGGGLEAAGQAARLPGPVGETARATMALWVTSALAHLGLFVGLRARWYRPERVAAWLFGVVGAGLYVLSLAMPVLPKEMGTVPLAMNIKLLLTGEALPMTIGLCLGTACTLVAAVICILNRPGTPGAKAHHMARRGFLLLVLGIAAPIGGAALAAQQGATGALPGALVAAVVVTAVKMAVSFGVLVMLVPIGLSDIVVGTAWRRQAPPRKAPSPLDYAASPLNPGPSSQMRQQA